MRVVRFVLVARRLAVPRPPLFSLALGLPAPERGGPAARAPQLRAELVGVGRRRGVPLHKLVLGLLAAKGGRAGLPPQLSRLQLFWGQFLFLLLGPAATRSSMVVGPARRRRGVELLVGDVLLRPRPPHGVTVAHGRRPELGVGFSIVARRRGRALGGPADGAGDAGLELFLADLRVGLGLPP